MTIALLTDFGTSDYFVGAVKGSILTIDPAAVIVDITHDIVPHDICSAARVLAACCLDFPPETIFTAVVDPGVGSGRRAIAVRSNERIFVAPDNGILSDAVGDAEYQAFAITNDKYIGARRSTTFHGRDLFGPVAAYISLGVPLSELGPRVEDLTVLERSRPKVEGASLIAEITHIDRFGNIITNLTDADIPAAFELRLNGHQVSSKRDAYADAELDELFLIAGSSGFIEISLRERSAAAFTRSSPGEEVTLLAKRPHRS